MKNSCERKQIKCIYNLQIALVKKNDLAAELCAHKQRWQISDHVIPVTEMNGSAITDNFLW